MGELSDGIREIASVSMADSIRILMGHHIYAALESVETPDRIFTNCTMQKLLKHVHKLFGGL